MSGLPTGLHAWNARCQAWNLMSGLLTGLHACNARCQAWNLVSLVSMHGIQLLRLKSDKRDKEK